MRLSHRDNMFIFLSTGSSRRCCALVKSLTHEGESACYLAAKHGHLAVVRLLLKARADINQLTNDSSCPLYAGMTVHTVMVDKIPLCLVHTSARYCFLTAVNGGYKEIVELLVRNGAEVNRTHTASCWTCLHQAVYKVITQFATTQSELQKHTLPINLFFPLLLKGHSEIVRVLVRVCHLEAPDDHNISPLFLAAQYGKQECLEILVNAGEYVISHL